MHITRYVSVTYCQMEGGFVSRDKKTHKEKVILFFFS